MIARLVGVVVSSAENRVVLDVRDVGYEVHGPTRDVEQWAAGDGPVTIHVHTDVREDAIVLYGFARDLDRVAFERLRAVNGVGPKVALSALDALGLEGLASAVAMDDVKGLTAIPGVGKKLAQRLALELKGKLPGGFDADGATAAVTARPKKRPADDQLDLALARLGYTRTEINRAHALLDEEGIGRDAPVAERLRAALRLLSGS